MFVIHLSFNVTPGSASVPLLIWVVMGSRSEKPGFRNEHVGLEESSVLQGGSQQPCGLSSETACELGAQVVLCRLRRSRAFPRSHLVGWCPACDPGGVMYLRKVGDGLCERSTHTDQCSPGRRLEEVELSGRRGSGSGGDEGCAHPGPRGRGACRAAVVPAWVVASDQQFCALTDLQERGGDLATRPCLTRRVHPLSARGPHAFHTLRPLVPSRPAGDAAAQGRRRHPCAMGCPLGKGQARAGRSHRVS